MSSYLNFTIERKNENDNWVCVAESTYDENLDIINPYILKPIFFDTDCYQIEDSEISEQAWYKFTSKIERQEQYGTDYPYQYKYILPEIFDTPDRKTAIETLEKICHSKNKHNDLLLKCDISNIDVNKDALLTIFSFISSSESTIDTNSMNLYHQFVEEKNNEKLKEILSKIGNVTQNIFTFLYDDSPFSLLETLKYNCYFRDYSIIRSISLVDYYDSGIKLRQYEYDYKISYRKDIQYMLKEIEKQIKTYELNNKAENIAKEYIADILEGYDHERNTELYKKLKKYCKNYTESDDEYYEELMSQKAELEKVLMFMGNNGRMLWSIDW